MLGAEGERGGRRRGGRGGVLFLSSAERKIGREKGGERGKRGGGGRANITSYLLFLSYLGTTEKRGRGGKGKNFKKIHSFDSRPAATRTAHYTSLLGKRGETVHVSFERGGGKGIDSFFSSHCSQTEERERKTSRIPMTWREREGRGGVFVSFPFFPCAPAGGGKRARREGKRND